MSCFLYETKLKLANGRQDLIIPWIIKNMFKKMIKRQMAGIVSAMKKTWKFFISTARK